jgi:hypothetical protein
MIFYPIGLVLTAIRLVAQAGSWQQILLSIAITVVISLLLPYLGLWGGADGKGFICLALMNPVTPAFTGNLFHVVDPLFPVVVFSNAYVASLCSVLYPAQRNLRTRPVRTLFEGLEHESLPHKVAAFFTGYRVRIDELSSKPYLFLLESIHLQESKVKRSFNFTFRIDLDYSKQLAEVKRAAELGLLPRGIWASPGLPFLVLRFDPDTQYRACVLGICTRFLKTIFHLYRDNIFLIICTSVFSEQFLVQLEESVTPPKRGQKFSGL